ncbi:MAG: hypothetical protein ACFFCS_06175 [Candidatus Hodarchaeota archaeon]
MNDEGFSFRHVSPKNIRKDLASSEQIVLTKYSESSEIPKGPITLTFDDVKYAITKENVQNFFYLFKVWIETGREKFDNVVIGIDPGYKNTGIALFINNALIEAATIPTMDDKIMKFIDNFLKDLLKKHSENDTVPIKVKIGNGIPIEMKKVISLLLGMNIFQKLDLNLEVVDEFQTNTPYLIRKSKFMKIGKDQIAAINIGLRQGKHLSVENFEGNNNKVTRKQVKNIQDESRRLTNESLSISEGLATKVLLGKLSLPEAIQMQKSLRKSN